MKTYTGLHEEALCKAGYKEKLSYIEPSGEPKSRNRKRNVSWFNPPYSVSVKTNIGQEFLRIMDECFPKNHILSKIINRNTCKISYSCMPNMERRIKSENSKKLSKNSNEKTEDLDCKCRSECPIGGECKKSNVIYNATVITKEGNVNKEYNYIGLTATSFITRYRNHVQSFKKQEHSNATELSKFVWECKTKNVEYVINWRVMKSVSSYQPGNKFCNLCTAEAVYIAYMAGNNSLNKKNEIIKNCRHKSRWKLEKFKNF